MKMKRTSLILTAALAFAAFVTGCTGPNSQISTALVQQGVFTFASYAVAKNPTIKPYLAAATPVICSAATGTNGLSPEAVVAAIEASPIASQLKTPEAMLALNGVMMLYIGIWDSYGTSVNLTTMQPYLLATCNGLTAALPANPVSSKASKKINWPLVR
jgi:hypothetical protein